LFVVTLLTIIVPSITLSKRIVIRWNHSPQHKPEGGERERERERERDVQIRLLGLALGHAPPLLFSIPNMQGFDIPTGDANPTLLLLPKEPLLLWV
jgi:hypothetical protein